MTELFTDMHGNVAMILKLIPGKLKAVPSVSDFDFFKMMWNLWTYKRLSFISGSENGRIKTRNLEQLS